MASRHSAPIGAPCWVDLMTSDIERARGFYAELFGWTADEPDPRFGGYFNFEKNGVLIAGCMVAQPGAGLPDVWSIYLATDDAAKTVAAAAENGGQIHVEPMKVGSLGTMAVVGDPTGGTIGVWQPETHQGFGLVAEPGAPGWFELQTGDYEEAVRFYRNVFRWHTRVMSDTADFRYTLLVDGDTELAGIMDASALLPRGVPAQWSVYFATDDVDAAAAKTVEAGGRVLRPAEDTPYGRIARVTDATGAEFKLVAPGEAVPVE